MDGGLPSTRAFQALGFAFRFESNDDVLVEVMERCYRDMPDATDEPSLLRAEWRPAAEEFHVTLTVPGSEPEVCEETVAKAGAVEVLAWEVNHRATQSRATWPVLHAAVIGGPRGAVALCGRSHSGKSTLAGGAARRGWRHLSDDLAPIDIETMTVHPYARPIMLRAGAREHLGELPALPEAHLPYLPTEWFSPASALGATIVRAPQPLLAIAFLAWRDVVELEALTRAKTLHELLLHSMTITGLGGAGFRDLERVASAVPGHQLRRGDVTTALDTLASILGP